MKLKRWIALCLALLLLPLLSGCFALDLLEELMDDGGSSSGSSHSSREDDDDDDDRRPQDSAGVEDSYDAEYEYIVPNPAMSLSGAYMETDTAVLNIDGVDYDFQLFAFYFESTEYNDGGLALMDYEAYFSQYYLDFVLVYSEEYYYEFEISYDGELLGYLTTQPGCWGLYILPHVALEGVTGESDFADRPDYSGGGYEGGCSGSSDNRCNACEGSGRCGTCGGDTIAHNYYTGENYECPNCDPSGDCSVCGGKGYY